MATQRTGAAIPAPAQKAGTGSIAKDKKRISTPWLLDALVINTLLWLVFLSGAYSIPRLWGWEIHWISCDAKSWSMCAPGGIPPLSVYYTARADQYKTGDIVSFDYQDNQDPSENGSTIKLVDKVAPGKVHVHGMNYANTMDPCWVPIDDIDGKIIAGPWSLLSERFWQWMSLNYTAHYQEIARRWNRLWSLEHALNTLTQDGRWRNKTWQLRGRKGVVVSENYAIFEGDGWLCLDRPVGKKVYHGYLLRHEETKLVVVKNLVSGEGVTIDVKTGDTSPFQATELDLKESEPTRVNTIWHGRTKMKCHGRVRAECVPFLAPVPWFGLPGETFEVEGRIKAIVTPAAEVISFRFEKLKNDSTWEAYMPEMTSDSGNTCIVWSCIGEGIRIINVGENPIYVLAVEM